jgi:hypothetical protein
MQARTTRRGTEEIRLAQGDTEHRWMLAVGKRIHHRWTVETSLDCRRGMPGRERRGRAAHAA